MKRTLPQIKVFSHIMRCAVKAETRLPGQGMTGRSGFSWWLRLQDLGQGRAVKRGGQVKHSR